MRRMLADDTPTPRLAVVPAPAVNAESGWAAAAEELLSGAGDVASVVPNLDEEGGDVDPGPDAAVPAQGFDWAEFNRSMRRKVLSWVEEDVSNICIMRWLMNYSTRLLARMFKLSGAEWERDQATQADDRSYRIVEAMMKRDLDPTFEEMEQAFCHVPPALPQKRWTRSTRSLTFRMLSRLSVSLDFHCASLREACPFVIAGLLLGEVAEGVAEEIFSMPRCVCDALTLKLRGMFPTPAALASSRAVAIVRGLAQLARVDVSNIECGHASVRHIVEGKSNQTKGQSQSQREGKRKHRSGGGGAQRAFVRERLRNTPAEQRTDKSAFFTRVNAEFRALSFEERKPYVALGEAATITHRAGESSFPKLPRTRTTVSSRRQQALSQSQPFLQEAYALTARAHAEAAAASARRKTQQQERESAHLQRLTALNADFPDPVPTELDASFLVLRSQARCAASVDSRV
eukprot:s568_g10.t1